MIDYVENPPKLTENNNKKTLLELRSDCSKFAGYQVKYVNIQNSIAFQYSSSEQLEFEIKSITLY